MCCKGGTAHNRESNRLINKKTSVELALFDFDGTVTKKDTFLDFITNHLSVWQFMKGLVLLFPWMVLYVLGMISHSFIKDKILRLFFNEINIQKFEKYANQYAETRLTHLIKREAAERITWHQSLGHEVYIVTASLEDWILPWCKKNNIKLIANQWDRNTARVIPPNCYAAGKVEKIHAVLDLSQYAKIYAYGDSKGDLEMLRLADEKYFKAFKY